MVSERLQVFLLLCAASKSRDHAPLFYLKFKLPARDAATSS